MIKPSIHRDASPPNLLTSSDPTPTNPTIHALAFSTIDRLPYPTQFPGALRIVSKFTRVASDKKARSFQSLQSDESHSLFVWGLGPQTHRTLQRPHQAVSSPPRSRTTIQRRAIFSCNPPKPLFAPNHSDVRAVCTCIILPSPRE